MKLNLKEITKAINEHHLAPETKWEYEEIELIETQDTLYGRMDKYKVKVRIKARKGCYSGIKYQINHYVDKDEYHVLYDGMCF